MVFQNYHRHSNYTNPIIADSAATNEEYAKRAKELGHGIISSCEHGWQGRYIEAYELAQEYGLKFVFATEAYWVKDRHQPDRTNCHIFIAAKNENGRQAINDILAEANISGYYGRPRIDKELILSLPPKDVIVTTACVAFWHYDDVDTFVQELKNHFQENFFLEVQYHNTQKQRDLNAHILDLHYQFNIPLIMGCDSHFITPEQAAERTDYIVSKKINYPEEDGWYMDYPDGDTAYQRFANQCVLSHEEIIEAMENTNVFLTVEEYNSPIFNQEIKMPTLYPELSQEQRTQKYLDLVWEKWNSYKKDIAPNQWPKYEQEIKKETDIVSVTHTADYFLLDYEIVQEGIRRGGVITPTGRGSGVSFFTNCLLGFTQVDRISAPVKMYPERFMSATRILQTKSLPDLDLNLANVAPFAEAQSVIMGAEHAYPMLAYGTQRLSAAWKMYCRAKEIPFNIANEISTQIQKYEKAFSHAEDDEKENINPKDYIDHQYHSYYEESQKYVGIIADWKIAPCSYLLYSGNIRKEIGLVKCKDNLCCCMDGKWADTYKFLKNDLLKVSVVDLISRTFKKINMPIPSEKELRQLCPPEDKAWEMYAKQCTLGLNQVEQTGTSHRVSVYAPKNISELCAFVAAIRPGFKSMYKIFESRKSFNYGIPSFDRIIQTPEMPNTFVLYQEMAMETLSYAGIPMSECYDIIKKIAKKKPEKVKLYKEQFLKGFSQKIQEEEHRPDYEADTLAAKVWQIIEDSSGYSFNASHSFCVSNDSLYCAYLKSHYPFEFYETYLNMLAEDGKKNKMILAKQEAESYFKIRFPSFRFGQDNRTIKANKEDKTITNSIVAIKGFGSSVAETLYQCGTKEYNSFVDVLVELDNNKIKSSVVSPLIKIDYFSKFGNQPTLNTILQQFDLCKQGNAITLKAALIKDSIFESHINQFATNINADGSESASYTFTNNDIEQIKSKKKSVQTQKNQAKKKQLPVDEYEAELEQLDIEYHAAVKKQVIAFLNRCEYIIKSFKIPEISLKTKIQNQYDILGELSIVTGEESDRRRLIVQKLIPHTDKRTQAIWGYSVFTQSIGTGKTGRFTLSANLYKQNPIKEEDIIYASDVWRNNKGYWNLLKYEKEF